MKRSAPAALRNREPIAEVLREWLPTSGTVLEIASGTGEHAVYFAGRFPNLQWQPTDVGADSIASIEEWRSEAGLENLLSPVVLDASAEDWPVSQAAAVLAINMAHISPWKATLGLLNGAAKLLPRGAPLIFYGPWLMDDVETAPSNLEFDQSLRNRNPSWGIRRVEDLAAAAKARGFELTERKAMPANNFMLLLRRSDPSTLNEVLPPPSRAGR